MDNGPYRLIHLNDNDFELLLLTLGIATAWASESNPAMFKSIVKLTNTINKDNPNWTPYEVKE